MIREASSDAIEAADAAPGPPGASSTLARLAAALAAAQAKIRPAARTEANDHFRSRYADLASVWEACRGPLTENGLAVLQLPHWSDESLTLRTVLVHRSGEWIESEYPIIGDYTNPQKLGSALTYARRYALMALVGVAPDDDGNAAPAPERAREAPRREARPATDDGNREAAAPARRVDRRPYRQLIEETAREAARKFEEQHPGARPFVTPFQLNRHLHKEAVSFGFAPEAGTLTEGQVFTVMTQVYGQQKRWVREELGAYLKRCRAEAERKAAAEESGVAAEGPAREPGQDG